MFNATLHHFGFVVASISESQTGFSRFYGGAPWSVTVHDPIQRVRVAFLQPPGGSAQIELVEPAADDSPVKRFLGKGGGLHHLCYEVPDIESTLEAARDSGAYVVSPPSPAVAFGGRRIAWVMTPERLLVEFLESERER